MTATQLSSSPRLSLVSAPGLLASLLASLVAGCAAPSSGSVMSASELAKCAAPAVGAAPTIIRDEDCITLDGTPAYWHELAYEDGSNDGSLSYTFAADSRDNFGTYEIYVRQAGHFLIEARVPSITAWPTGSSLDPDAVIGLTQAAPYRVLDQVDHEIAAWPPRNQDLASAAGWLTLGDVIFDKNYGVYRLELADDTGEPYNHQAARAVLFDDLRITRLDSEEPPPEAGTLCQFIAEPSAATCDAFADCAFYACGAFDSAARCGDRGTKAEIVCSDPVATPCPAISADPDSPTVLDDTSACFSRSGDRSHFRRGPGLGGSATFIEASSGATGRWNLDFAASGVYRLEAFVPAAVVPDVDPISGQRQKPLAGALSRTAQYTVAFAREVDSLGGSASGFDHPIMYEAQIIANQRTGTVEGRSASAGDGGRWLDLGLFVFHAGGLGEHGGQWVALNDGGEATSRLALDTIRITRERPDCGATRIDGVTIDNYCMHQGSTRGCLMTARGGYCDPLGDGHDVVGSNPDVECLEQNYTDADDDPCNASGWSGWQHLHDDYLKRVITTRYNGSDGFDVGYFEMGRDQSGANSPRCGGEGEDPGDYRTATHGGACAAY